jgi:hypothetical protein
MKGYSERCVFLPSVIRLHTFLSKVLEHFDSSPYGLGPDRELRCHELTRAVKRFMVHGDVPYHPPNVTLYDGKYSIVDHSWLEILAKSPEGLCSLYILDVYAVGQLPQVQLLDIAFSLPHRASYRPQAWRNDIDMDVVNLVYLDLISIGRKIFNDDE